MLPALPPNSGRVILKERASSRLTDRRSVSSPPWAKAGADSGTESRTLAATARQPQMRIGRFECRNDKLPVIGAQVQTVRSRLVPRNPAKPPADRSLDVVRERGGMRIFSCTMKGHFGASPARTRPAAKPQEGQSRTHKRRAAAEKERACLKRRLRPLPETTRFFSAGLPRAIYPGRGGMRRSGTLTLPSPTCSITASSDRAIEEGW